ncbi:putative uncharacterized protein [Coraliomargarita sp. CAG:312]|nr:putative uncharacterized protein [Coraliomargarita sp. CAG:312]
MNFFKAILVIFAAALVLAFFYFLTLLGPGKKVEYDYVYIDPERESKDILKESEMLEDEFEKASLAAKVTEADIEKLRRAIALQEVYIDKARLIDRAPAERLLKLQTRLDDTEAAPLAEIIAELEKKALAAETEEKDSEAVEIYKQLYDLQSRINTDYPHSKYKDIRKSAQFDSRVKMFLARPMYLKSVEAENAAREALEKGDWATAQLQFEKAIETITQMNSTYPTSVYTDFARLQKLDIELDSLKSSSLAAKINDYLEKARSAEAAGDHILASESYGDAVEVQKELNRLFPKSEHASDEKISDYEKKRVDAYSWKFAKEIVEQDKLLNRALYDGDFEKAKDISLNLLRKSEQFKTNFPRSQTVNDDLILRLRYITFMANNIPQIQKQVLGNLQKIEGFDSVEMLKTEVPQDLFILIMQENPSRDSDNPRKPVDSVTAEEISRFCNRLSWILGRNVSLPSKAQFKAAVGSLRYADLNEISWNNINSGGHTHPVATKKPNDRGFYDLLGNVGEYVISDDEDAVSGYKIIGGGAQTQTDSMLDLSEFSMDEKQRNRMVGFRIVVSKSYQE